MEPLKPGDKVEVKKAEFDGCCGYNTVWVKAEFMGMQEGRYPIVKYPDGKQEVVREWRRA